MLNTEKNKKKQSHQVRFAMGSFFVDATGTSTFTDLLPDFQNFFEVLMRSDEADDPEFRERAILMLQFCRLFDKNFSKFDWNTVYKEAERIKNDVSLKMLPDHEL